MAEQISDRTDNSKAATSGDHNNPGSLFAQPLRIVLSLDSGLGVTDRNHFDFHSCFSDFSNL